MKKRGITIDQKTGDLSIKIKRDKDGLITNGLNIGDVTKQNQAIIIYMHPGELKEKPTVGVGISSMSLSHEYLEYKHKIREQLEADGYQINHLDITNDQQNKPNIEINAQYRD